MGNLAAANALAEKVLEIDTNNVDAIYSKAESLYYNCEFERALLTYHRGSVSIRISAMNKYPELNNLSIVLSNEFPLARSTFSVVHWIKNHSDWAYKTARMPLSKH